MIVCLPCPSSLNEVALDIDESSYGNLGKAGGGGLIRDYEGRWVIGFSSHLKFATSLEAELLAILHGLRIAWELNFKDVSCRSDCIEALSLILNPISDTHRYARSISRIRELIGRDWSTSFSHIHKESNQYADFLAKASANSTSGLKIFSKPPDALSSVLLSDAKGTPYQRGNLQPWDV